MWTDERLEHLIEGKHNHLPDRDKVELSKLHSTIRESASKETTLISIIYREKTIRFSRENQSKISHHLFLSIQSNLYKAMHVNTPSLPTHFTSLEDSAKLRTITKGANFLLYHFTIFIHSI